MNHWTATEELRFVEREVAYAWVDGEPKAFDTHTILQQKWELWEYIEGYGFSVAKEEWRDVPVVEEE
jgi:hypothetical protein